MLKKKQQELGGQKLQWPPLKKREYGIPSRTLRKHIISYSRKKYPNQCQTHGREYKRRLVLKKWGLFSAEET